MLGLGSGLGSRLGLGLGLGVSVGVRVRVRIRLGHRRSDLAKWCAIRTICLKHRLAKFNYKVRLA